MRKKIETAVIDAYRRFASARNQEHVLRDAMKHMPDGNLIAFAITLGIDTNKVLEQTHIHNLAESCASCSEVTVRS